MRLSDWLKETKTKRYKFAEMIGVQPSVVTDYCEGRIWPGKDKIEAITQATNGSVTANDFLSDKAKATIDAATIEAAQ